MLPGLERNAVVAASAGTGKTQLITSIYIAHTLGLGRTGRVAPERIVATTFSRLAAQEIRERLERRLAELQSLKEDESAPVDQALASYATDQGISRRELSLRAARALSELPRSLIDTLHGLAARVLRNQALEIGVGAGFTILDEQAAFEDAESTIEDVLSQALLRGGTQREAVLRLIDAAGGLDATRGSLIGFLGLLDEEGLDADELASLDARSDSAPVREAFSLAAGALLDDAADAELREKARTVLRALGSDPPDLDSLEAAFAPLIELKAQRVAKLPRGAAFSAALDGLLRGSSKRARLRASASFLRLAPELERDSREIAAIIGSVQRALRTHRKRRGALGFGDLLRLARDSLRDRPELAERAAAEIDLLLVDEFQDTSRVQRDLILLLRERQEERARRSPGELPRAEALLPHGLIVVGDRKQSIYAFRGADVSVYSELVAELAGEPAAQALDIRGVRVNDTPVADFVPLTTNYRSGANILSFVNALAAVDFSSDPTRAFEIRYSDAEALRPPADGRKGDGRVTLLLDEGGVPDGVDALVANADKALRTAFIVAGYCAHARAAGTSLTDIAILARRRSSLPLVELALDRLGLPFVVSGRALYATLEVRDMAALLRAALDPYDRHALAAVARSPLGGLSDRALVELSIPGRGLPRAANWATNRLSDSLDAARAKELARRLGELELTLPLLSPRDALACAIERFELEAVLGGLPRGPVRFGNIGRLLEIAARHGGNLPMFVRWLHRQIALETDESEAAVFSEDDDAIRLLTIHASKGLSFPVTIVIDVGVAEQPRSSPIGLLRSASRAPELVIRHRTIDGPVETPLLARAREDAQARSRAERQRLSYVALTRAERELVIAVPQESRSGSLGSSIQKLLLDDLTNELPIERVRADELLAVPPVTPAPLPLPSPPPPKPPIPRLESVTIGVTALADFDICARRFSLLHVVGVTEPGRPLGEAAQAGEDGRRLGSAAHRVLERYPLEQWGASIALEHVLEELAREGLDPNGEETRATAVGIQRFLSSAYAGEVHRTKARVHRELELSLVLTLPDEAPRAGSQLDLFAAQYRPRRTIIKAMLDVVVEHADGSIDVLDYKRSAGGDEDRYAFQLSTYAQAARAAFQATTVRTGLVHLLGRSEEPEWLTPPDADLATLVGSLALHRYRDEYPPVSPDRCRRARCGFIGACYPELARRPNAGPSRAKR